jgi:hypothetical protein
VSLLDSTRDELLERNAPLCLILGLISLSRRFDRATTPAATATSCP